MRSDSFPICGPHNDPFEGMSDPERLLFRATALLRMTAEASIPAVMLKDQRWMVAIAALRCRSPFLAWLVNLLYPR